MKQIKTTAELISHMKDKGIQFNIISETEAEKFLETNNYYMKLASYRANYDKYPVGHQKEGKYKALEFAYLKELSLIDMHLRYLILDMTLDIEHFIKVKLVDKISKIPTEDGYQTVKTFLAQDTSFRILKTIKSHGASEYCKELIDKYFPYFPVWVFVEVITFGDLLHFCEFYQQTHNDYFIDHKLMNIIRDFRNASAHSNCLLNHLSERLDSTKQPDCKITTFIKNIPTISKSSRRNNLRNKFTYNFITLLFIYGLVVSDSAKKSTYKRFKEFMDTRALKHKDYFENKNMKIDSVYKFLKKVIDFLAN